MADFKNYSEIVEQNCKLLKQFNLSKIKISCEEYEIEIEANNFKPQNFSFQTMPQQIPSKENLNNEIEQNSNCEIVKSSIVGTFYSAPAPGEEPFVKVGDAVKKGDVLFIIESMKLMNEVKSDFDGVVKQIFVENGDSLEFDQKVMEIEPK